MLQNGPRRDPLFLSNNLPSYWTEKVDPKGAEKKESALLWGVVKIRTLELQTRKSYENHTFKDNWISDSNLMHLINWAFEKYSHQIIIIIIIVIISGGVGGGAGAGGAGGGADGAVGVGGAGGGAGSE